MEKIWQSMAVVIPIIFVLAFGYFAGRKQAFGSGPGPLKTMNKLVLSYALPSSLFAGTVIVSRQQLISDLSILLVMLITMIGGFLIIFLIARYLLKRTIITACLQALAISMPAGPFYGPALLSPVYGTASSMSVSMVSIAMNVFLVPLAMVLLIYDSKQALAKSGNQSSSGASIRAIVSQSLYHAFFKTPLVWASCLGFIVVLIGVPVPPVITASLDLIGKATAGVAVFICGLTLAGNKIVLDTEVWLNFVLKNIALAGLFLLVALVLGLNVHSNIFGEGTLLIALPTAPLVVLLAQEYGQYQQRASATLGLTTVGMIVTITALILIFQR